MERFLVKGGLICLLNQRVQGKKRKNVRVTDHGRQKEVVNDHDPDDVKRL